MPRTVLPTLASLFLLVATADVPADEFWPGWLGPQRDGWVHNFQPPAQWPGELTKTWQLKVGSGYGSPLVDGDRVYLHSRQAGDEVVWCVARQSGDVIWRKTHPVPFKMGGGGESHGKGPKSCPVLAGGRIFTMSITGILTAWDAASGEQLWQRDYGDRFKGSRENNSHPYWGACTSPIVDGERVIVHFGTDNEGELVALNVENGDVVWSLGNDGASYSSPLLVELHGIRQVVEWNHEALVGVESQTGRLLWTYPAPHVGTDQNMPTPVMHKGRVLLGGENRGIQCIQPARNGDGWTVTQRWHQKEVALDMSSAVINDGYLYGFSHYGRGRVFSLDPESGDVLWQSPGRTGANATFLSLPGHIAVLINNGELRIVRANSEKYQPAASWRVATTPTWAPPVLLRDGVLVKDVETLSFWSFNTDALK